ncbi:MAG: hypothetical protein AB1454_12340 [Candidatus Auribacterota bacterium]
MFKCCTLCNRVWDDRHAFLSDEHLALNGYQVNFHRPEKGLFLFTHTTCDCNTTIAVEVEMFVGLFHGQRYDEARTGLEDCTGKCLIKNNLERCDAHCKFSFIRDLMSIINDYEKCGGGGLKLPEPVSDKKSNRNFDCQLADICFRCGNS